MHKMPQLVDMARTPEEKKDNSPMVSTEPNSPIYPWGLTLRLTQDELQKLDVDYDDWQVGDHFHLVAMAKITSISENETEKGKNCNVELQIVALSGENEDTEYEESEEPVGMNGY